MIDNYADILREELTRLGVTDFQFSHGGKHPRVHFTWKGVRKMYVFSASPSDGQHGRQNLVADLRRYMGVQAPKRPKSEREPKQKAPPVQSRMPDSFTVKPDPMTALKAWKPPSRCTWIRVSGNTWRVEMRAK